MSKPRKRDSFLKGLISMGPVIPGIIPFGMIMGTVASEAGLSMPQTMGMNVVVFAGASQLATIELLTKDAPSIVIILTGLIINLRFLLYSAASSTYLKESNLFVKVVGAYSLTDQSYAVSSANDRFLISRESKVFFTLGAALCMTIFWHLFVLSGFYFGNIIPKSLSLDFAVPLSFMALTIPSLVTRTHLLVGIISISMSILLKDLPFNLGLICTAGFCIFIADRLTHEVDNE
jgi:predicted branched-subunit amino acid permease